MGERAKIEEKLRRKEAEIQSFEEKIKAARVYVQALRDVLRMLDDEPDDVQEDTGDTVLRPGSSVAQARDAIFARGAPMHVDDILKAIGKASTRGAKASIIGSLSAYVRRGEIFTRPAPNTFGLSELGHTEALSTESEPPPGFGAMVSASPDDDEDIPF